VEIIALVQDAVPNGTGDAEEDLSNVSAKSFLINRAWENHRDRGRFELLHRLVGLLICLLATARQIRQTIPKWEVEPDLMAVQIHR